MYKAVLFDFDGTLCDTGRGVKRSARYALESMGFACPPEEEMDYFIGPPLFDSFKKHGATDEEARQLIEKYREDYREDGLFESALYEGVEALLSALRQDGVLLGVASSKPTVFVKRLLDYFHITEHFAVINGVDLNADRESKQHIIARTLDDLGVSAEQALMVGDRSYDISGAKADGMGSVGVLWGYGTEEELTESGADYLAEKPHDIESIALAMYERTTAVNTVLKGRILHMHVDDVLLCDGTVSKRECVDHPGGVAVIGMTDEGLIPVVRQFRYPYKETMIEIPAGKVEPGEDPFITGQREFKEECGAVADNYFSLGEIYPSPGYTNEIIRLYGATGIRFEEQALDDGEILEVNRLSLEEMMQRIMSGEIKDAKTVTAVFKLKEYLKQHDLFR